MTAAATRIALERIMAEVAGAERSTDIEARWGEPRPSERSATGRRIAAPSEPAFAALEVEPWEDDAGGGVEIDFAEDAAPALADLEAWFGPLEEVPPMPYEPSELRGQWWREGMPVRVVLLVEESGDGTARRVTLQRGITRPE